MTDANTTPTGPTPTGITANGTTGTTSSAETAQTETEPTTTQFFPVSKPTDETATSAAATERKRRPLFPTILWGAMMLALASFIAAGELVPGGFDVVTWLLTAVVGIGLLLVVAGIAAAARRAG
jgi:predicted lipid-binding transport protein (Tim44 family)